MRTYTFEELDCPLCEAQSLTLDVELVSSGSPGIAPSFDYPGDPPEGPVLSFGLAVCAECGTLSADVVEGLADGPLYDELALRIEENSHPEQELP